MRVIVINNRSRPIAVVAFERAPYGEDLIIEGGCDKKRVSSQVINQPGRRVEQGGRITLMQVTRGNGRRVEKLEARRRDGEIQPALGAVESVGNKYDRDIASVHYRRVPWSLNIRTGEALDQLAAIVNHQKRPGACRGRSAVLCRKIGDQHQTSLQNP